MYHIFISHSPIDRHLADSTSQLSWLEQHGMVSVSVVGHGVLWVCAQEQNSQVIEVVLFPACRERSRIPMVVRPAHIPSSSEYGSPFFPACVVICPLIDGHSDRGEIESLNVVLVCQFSFVVQFGSSGSFPCQVRILNRFKNIYWSFVIFFLLRICSSIRRIFFRFLKSIYLCVSVRVHGHVCIQAYRSVQLRTEMALGSSSITLCLFL